MRSTIVVCIGVTALLFGCSSGGGGGDDAGLDGPMTRDGDGEPRGTGVATDAGPSADTGSDAQQSVPPGTIQGVVTRTSQLTFTGDGKGKLWIDIGTSCPYTGNIQVTKTVTVPTVDLNPMNVVVPFTMTGVSPGTYYVWGWLDDNGDNQPFPMGGDPGNYPTCAQVTLTANAGAAATLVFNSSTWN